MSTEAFSAQLADLLKRDPFEPFRIVTTDGRTIEVTKQNQAILNSLAISVVEEAFSVTVIGLPQIREIVTA